MGKIRSDDKKKRYGDSEHKTHQFDAETGSYVVSDRGPGLGKKTADEYREHMRRQGITFKKVGGGKQDAS